MSEPNPFEQPEHPAEVDAVQINGVRWRSDREVLNAVNASCSCGGKPLGEGCCPACEVWHRLHR